MSLCGATGSAQFPSLAAQHTVCLRSGWQDAQRHIPSLAASMQKALHESPQPEPDSQATFALAVYSSGRLATARGPVTVSARAIPGDDDEVREVEFFESSSFWVQTKPWL